MSGIGVALNDGNFCSIISSGLWSLVTASFLIMSGTGKAEFELYVVRNWPVGEFRVNKKSKTGQNGFLFTDNV